MIEFNDGYGNWVMRLNNGKVVFNREHWTECEPDTFAKAVIQIIEKANIDMDNWNKKMT